MGRKGRKSEAPAIENMLPKLELVPIMMYFGFVAPPAFFFLILTAMLLAYLLAVEGMKRWFFLSFATE